MAIGFPVRKYLEEEEEDNMSFGSFMGSAGFECDMSTSEEEDLIERLSSIYHLMPLSEREKRIAMELIDKHFNVGSMFYCGNDSDKERKGKIVYHYVMETPPATPKEKDNIWSV